MCSSSSSSNSSSNSSSSNSSSSSSSASWGVRAFHLSVDASRFASQFIHARVRVVFDSGDAGGGVLGAGTTGTANYTQMVAHVPLATGRLGVRVGITADVSGVGAGSSSSSNSNSSSSSSSSSSGVIYTTNGLAALSFPLWNAGASGVFLGSDAAAEQGMGLVRVSFYRVWVERGGVVSAGLGVYWPSVGGTRYVHGIWGMGHGV